MEATDKYDVEKRLARFRAAFLEIELGQNEFGLLRETKFHDLWKEFCNHTYDARCALQKLQSAVAESKDTRWYE